jgi:uncharacterized membrane protein YqiK
MNIVDPITLASGCIFVVVLLLVLRKFRPTRISLEEGEALIRSRNAERLPGAGLEVSFTTTYAIPAFDHWEKVDTTRKPLVYSISGETGDGTPYSLEATFTAAVPQDAESVLRVARNLGAQATRDTSKITDLLRYSLIRRVEDAAIRVRPDDTSFQKEVAKVVGDDFAGFRIEDVEVTRVTLGRNGGQQWIQ